jgi:hypothetical protein
VTYFLKLGNRCSRVGDDPLRSLIRTSRIIRSQQQQNKQTNYYLYHKASRQYIADPKLRKYRAKRVCVWLTDTGNSAGCTSARFIRNSKKCILAAYAEFDKYFSDYFQVNVKLNAVLWDVTPCGSCKD